MNHYPFHIGDYIKSTVHLTDVEDLAYRRLIDLYYDSERPISKETQGVSKRLRLDHQIVLRILQEFFFEQEDGWHNKRCDREIEKYQAFIQFGKDGAAKRWGKTGYSHPIATLKPPLSGANSNQNQNRKPEPKKNIGPSALRGNGSDPTPIVESLPLNDGTEYAVHQSSVAEYERLYPAVDVPQTLREMRGWCLGNKSRRKTKRGVDAFITRWLSKEQDRHG